VDNIEMDLGEIGWDGMEWIEQAQDSSYEHGDEPTGFLKIAWNFLNGCTIGSFSGRAQLRK
jgi:hypothetical protein